MVRQKCSGIRRSYLGVFRRRVICQLIGSTVDGRHFCNISCFPFAPEALGTV